MGRDGSKATGKQATSLGTLAGVFFFFFYQSHRENGAVSKVGCGTVE
jgi:hypothetical protein